MQYKLDLRSNIPNRETRSIEQFIGDSEDHLSLMAQCEPGFTEDLASFCLQQSDYDCPEEAYQLFNGLSTIYGYFDQADFDLLVRQLRLKITTDEFERLTTTNFSGRRFLAALRAIARTLKTSKVICA